MPALAGVAQIDTDGRVGFIVRMAIRKTRNVSLTPELEAFVDGRVASGRYRSASEVVRAALRLLEEDERRREAPRRVEPSETGRMLCREFSSGG
jgi:antitoxin ParD1/3/4